MRKTTIGVTTVMILSAGTGLAAAKARTATPYDFNGDGYRDLPVGVPSGLVGKVSGAGFVAVTNGGKGGVNPAKRIVISQSSKGVPGTVEKGDGFGSALASGDFDGDGYADLAIGAGGEDIGKVTDAGSVTIVFGSKKGLSSRSVAFNATKPLARQKFGLQLAAGDFNKDGRTDLAIGGDSVSSYFWIYSGAKKPGTKVRAVSPGKDGTVDTIAVGDVTGDGYADVAVSWYWDDPADEGETSVFAGSAKGLAKKVGPSIELGDTNGVAIGDVNKDGKGDVIIGGTDEPGFRIYPGTAKGMDQAHGKQYPDGSAPVVTGDINGDGYADVASRLAYDSSNEAVVTVRLGGPKGLTNTTYAIKEKTAHIPPNQNNWFGTAVSLLDLNGDHKAELLVTAPGYLKGTLAYVPGGPTLPTTKLLNANSFKIAPTTPTFNAVLP